MNIEDSADHWSFANRPDGLEKIVLLFTITGPGVIPQAGGTIEILRSTVIVLDM
jgi:hypothetical protein